MFIQILCPFFKLSYLSLLLSCKSALYILDTNPCKKCILTNMCSLSVVCLFIFSWYSWDIKVLNFHEVQLTCFFHLSPVIFGAIFGIALTQDHKYLSVFSACFRFLALIEMLIPELWTFLYMWGRASNLNPFMDNSNHPALFVKKVIFPLTLKLFIFPFCLSGLPFHMLWVFLLVSRETLCFHGHFPHSFFHCMWFSHMEYKL